MAARQRANLRLPPEVNRALYVRNLPFKITAEEMYDIFGKFGAIRQVRLGNAPDTRGTAFVVYEDIYDAKNAVDHLSGFNVCGRYLVRLPLGACAACRMRSILFDPEVIEVPSRFRTGCSVLSADENAETPRYGAGTAGTRRDARQAWD
jgi:RNA recognition motif-containing protein